MTDEPSIPCHNRQLLVQIFLRWGGPNEEAARSVIEMDLLEQHPIGQILPPMSPEEYYSLRNDLVVHGLRVPILRYEGQILGG